MTQNPVTIFMLGKGGTGKSTAAALMALELAGRGKKTLLASFDDAHNLADIFDRPLNHRPKTVCKGLEVLQADRGREIKTFLSRTTQKVKQSYTYLTAFNLDHYFDVLKYAPGMEAHALAATLKKLARAPWDVLIIDMPPTALSMHFFNLPRLSLLWVDQLEKLRTEINRKKEIISKIKFAGKEIQRDKVLARIKEIKSDHLALKTLFEDPGQSLFFAVHNRDRLSLAETGRIIRELDRLEIPLTGLISNCRNQAAQVETPQNLQDLPVLELPFSPAPLIGIDALKQYTADRGVSFSPLLP